MDGETFERIENPGLEDMAGNAAGGAAGRSSIRAAAPSARMDTKKQRRSSVRLASVRCSDRVVQMAAVLVLGPIFEADPAT